MGNEQAEILDAVKWSYRLLLGREPESSQIIEDHAYAISPKTIEGVRFRFTSSGEYQKALETSLNPVGVLLANVTFPLRDSASYPREVGFYRDLFGVRTRLSYLPDIYAKYSGGVPGDFGIEHLPMHDTAELRGMLDAASSAEQTFSVMELGAGWGPWVAMGGAIARRRGLPYRLIAVEGSAEHACFLDTHLRDNEIDPADHRIIHGVVGGSDGSVRFKKMPGTEYGATIISDDLNSDDFEELQSYSIATLLNDEPVIDILHCDIQGHEYEALASGIQSLNTRVRRIVIGTHGRAIEEQLHGLFSGNGWNLMQDIACVVTVENMKTVLVQDGAQYWCNPLLVRNVVS